MKNFFCFLCCVLLTQAVVKAQMKIGDNPTTINSASLLELEAINKGLVFPRVALTGLSSSSPLPAELLTGTVVFNTAAGVGSGVGLYYWNGSAWVGIGSGGSTPAPAWYITGNAGTLSSDFIGTTDNRSFRVRTNDIQRMIIDSFGNVTIDSAVFITKGQMKIGDDPTAINSASLLELESVDKGIVFPRISIPDAASPAPLPAELLVGTVVYNTNASINKGKGPGLYIWSGGEWSPVSFKEKDAWSVNGNTAISPDSNFLGTTDSVGLHIRTSNKQRMLIDSIGSVAIGLPTFNPDPLNRELLVVDQGPSLSHTVASFKGNKHFP